METDCSVTSSPKKVSDISQELVQLSFPGGILAKPSLTSLRCASEKVRV